MSQRQHFYPTWIAKNKLLQCGRRLISIGIINEENFSWFLCLTNNRCYCTANGCAAPKTWDDYAHRGSGTISHLCSGPIGWLAKYAPAKIKNLSSDQLAQYTPEQYPQIPLPSIEKHQLEEGNRCPCIRCARRVSCNNRNVEAGRLLAPSPCRIPTVTNSGNEHRISRF